MLTLTAQMVYFATRNMNTAAVCGVFLLTLLEVYYEDYRNFRN